MITRWGFVWGILEDTTVASTARHEYNFLEMT